ncbi:TATA-binding protein-associated factor 2N [Hyalella azteca]|uniref:TATA-binding protein-associated factor 2N n=1 Tax=Hyalella azteca TaxID=294128 RepID=A0A8B7PIS8_HYAAZ|nr:TATA-binding protein-associated factor 2N [Hyalella azteca]
MKAAWLYVGGTALLCHLLSPVSGFFSFSSSSSSKPTSKIAKTSSPSRAGSLYDASYAEVGYGAVEDSAYLGVDTTNVDPYEVLDYSGSAFASPGTIDRHFSKGYSKGYGYDDHDDGYGHDHGGYGHDHGGYGHDDYGKGKGKGNKHKSWWKSWTSKGKGYKSKGKGHKGKKSYGYKKGTYKEICYLVPEHDHGYHDSGYHRR